MGNRRKVEVGKRVGKAGRRELLIDGRCLGYILPDLDYVDGGWKQRAFTAQIDMGYAEGYRRWERELDKTVKCNWKVDRWENEDNPMTIKEAINKLIDEIRFDIHCVCDPVYGFLKELDKKEQEV